MSIGIITGSGTYALPGFADAEPITVETPFGPCTATPRKPTPASMRCTSPGTAPGTSASPTTSNHRAEHLGAPGARARPP